MAVGGRWEVISDSISGGRVWRVGAGIFEVVWSDWLYVVVSLLDLKAGDLYCMMFGGVAFRCQAWKVGS